MFIVLMRRIAAHYVWCKQVYRMHYIELDDNEEIAGTAFYDGVLVPVLSSEPAIGFKQVMGSWPVLTEKITPGCSVHIYRLSGIPLASAKLGTDHGCSDGHIERL